MMVYTSRFLTIVDHKEVAKYLINTIINIKF